MIDIYKEIFTDFIKPRLLRLYTLTAHHPKTLLSGLWKKYLSLCKIIPGADVIFLGIFLAQIKMYVLFPFHLEDNCAGMFWEWMYDVYVTWFIVTGFVIYLTRRYVLTRKSS